MRLKSLLVSFGVVISLSSTMASAHEISLVQGLMQTEKNKNKQTDTNAGGSTTTTVGAVYGNNINGSSGLDYFAGALLRMKSFDAPDGGKAPSNRSSVAFNGGVRFYAPVNSQSLLPFAAAKAEYRQMKDGEILAGGYRETDEDGLYYGVDVGIRGLFAEKYFIDFFIPVFQSALFSTSRKVTRDTNGNVTADTETTKTDLYVDSDSQLVQIGIGLGMKF